MIRYNRLFALLALKGMKKTDLLKVISSPTLAKLSKGEIVKTDIIDRICIYLECQPSDIMEVYETSIEQDSISGKFIKITSISEYDYTEGKTNTNIDFEDI